MSFWLYDITILFQNYRDFYPKKNMTYTEKANSLMRLALYYSILLIIFNLDSSWLTISFLLIGLSIFIGTTEKFTATNNKNCIKPTKNNPYMNFTLGDNINNPQRPAACKLNDEIRNEELKLFRKNINGDSTINKFNLYSKNNNDRNFYTMPSTTIVNDQTGFAKYLFGDFGRCKSEGINCLKHSDNRFHKGRYYYQY
jgi:hypothetical protein